MQVTERVVGEVVVLDVVGRMTRNDGSGVLKRQVSDRLERGRQKFVVNLSGIDYLDSTCVGELVSTVITVRNGGGELKLCGVNPRIQELLTIAKLHTVFDVYDSEPAAMASFTPA